MHKFLSRVAFAAALVLPAAAQAQIGTAEVTLSGRPHPVLAGGGFSTSVFDYTPFVGPAQDLKTYILWCIDDDLTVTETGSYSYQVYSFAGFAGVADANGAAMNRIASLLDPFQNSVNTSTFPNPATAAIESDQEEIWDNFDGLNGAGFDGYDSSEWYLLYNGTSQTLAFRVPGQPSIVPEPASLALLGLGMVGLVAVRRRRQA